MKRTTARRTALGLGLVAVAVAATAGLASSALFTSQDTNTANSFAAGTVDITAGTGTAVFSLTGLAPRSTQFGTLAITNAGSLALRYSVSSSTTGALAPALVLTAKAIPTATTCDAAALTTPDYTGPLSSFALGDKATGADAGDRSLAAASAEKLCLRVTFPESGSDNTYQGKSATTDITVDAEQTLNN